MAPEPSALMAYWERHAGGVLGSHEWALGGGTALAMHWDHRDSTDIDLFVREGEWNAWRASGGPRRMEEAAKRMGGQFETGGVHRIVGHGDDWQVPNGYKIRNVPYAPGVVGDVDVIRVHGSFDLGNEARLGVSRGRSFVLLHRETILAKKIGLRGERAKPRDLYDVAVALCKDWELPEDQRIMPKVFSLPAVGDGMAAMTEIARELANTGRWMSDEVQGELRSPRHREATEEAPRIVATACLEHMAVQGRPGAKRTRRGKGMER